MINILWNSSKTTLAWDTPGQKISSFSLMDMFVEFFHERMEIFSPCVSHAHVVFELFRQKYFDQLFKLCNFIYFWYRVFFLHQRENNRSHPLMEGYWREIFSQIIRVFWEYVSRHSMRGWDLFHFCLMLRKKKKVFELFCKMNIH